MSENDQTFPVAEDGIISIESERSVAALFARRRMPRSIPPAPRSGLQAAKRRLSGVHDGWGVDMTGSAAVTRTSVTRDA